MNKKLCISLLAVVLAGAMCIFGLGLRSQLQHRSPLTAIAQGEPIMPIRIASDTTLMYLTDYLPTLDVEHATAYCTVSGDHYAILDAEEPHSYLLVGNTPGICFFTLGTDSANYQAELVIPILPNLPVKQALTTVAADKQSVTLQASCPITQVEALVQNQYVSKVSLTEEGLIVVSLQGMPIVKGRSYLRVYATGEDCLLNDVLVPLENGQPVCTTSQLNRHDANAQVLYSLLVDRFFNGNPENDAPLCSPEVDPRVDYMGGDLKGITCKIEDGFFDSLGINTIWISPITQNPTDAWGNYPDPKTRFSGYHGYWPIYNTKIDDRMGTDGELKELLATAHKHQINVVLDYVANHMHINSPTLQAHPDWVTDSILPDGRRNFELWDEARLTTWFDVHIPSLDLEREEVCDNMTDTALYWVTNYDFDGYRHDACKHIPLNYWRMFTHKMKTRFPNRPLWMIGETYGDPALISSYVKTGMLNAQFDFNIYHTAIDVLGKPNQSMRRMADVIDESLAVYGAHHTMGNISGNHDKCRFISLAGGAVSWDENDKDAGWHREIGVTAKPDSALELQAFRKALILEAINLTIPGVPCIYQGDEYGQCGANDPDNRRMMRFEGLNDYEAQFRQDVQALIHLRRSSMPLIYGDYRRLYADDTTLIFSRTYMNERVIVAFNIGSEALDTEVEGVAIHVEPVSYNILY